MFTALTLGLALAPSLPAQAPRYIDRPAGRDARGEIIYRTSSQPDFSGGFVQVEQKLRRLSGGRYLIDFEDQTEATKVYHEALCLKDGLVRGTETGVLSGQDAVAAWSCQMPLRSPEIHQPAEEAHGAADAKPKAIDYAIVSAPSVSALVGQQFFAIGRMSVRSSIAGSLSYGVSVDNARCSYQSTEHSSTPFDAVSQKGVNCMGHRPGFLRTEMRACIPRACAVDSGTYGIR